MSLKVLDRAAKVTWGAVPEHKSLLVSGTIAGTIDDSFETKSQLEIYEVDFSDPSTECKLLGSVTTKDCFHSIAWGSQGIRDNSFPCGLIAGGMSDGSVNIWNASAILGGSKDMLLSRSEMHKGQVSGLEFHPENPGILASGSADGEVFIWDLKNARSPEPSKPTQKKAANAPAVTCLAWNKKVSQIIASSTETGITTIWDLRQKRSVITFAPSNRQQLRVTTLTWNPEATVQLAVGYSQSPVAEIWDLRQSMTPKTKLEGPGGQTLGYLSLDWSRHDTSMLLSSGEDGRLLCWDPFAGSVLCEYTSPQPGAHFFDAKWHPHMPSIATTASYENQVTVQSYQYGGSHVPSWHARPTGASFGFGGRIVSWGLHAPQQQPPATPTQDKSKPVKPAPVPHTVRIDQMVTDARIMDLSASFQQVMEHKAYPAFCDSKIAAAKTEAERTEWTFMRILFEDQAVQRERLLKELGHAPPNKAAADKQPAQANHAAAGTEEIPEEGFFDNIAANHANTEEDDEVSGLGAGADGKKGAAAAAKSKSGQRSRGVSESKSSELDNLADDKDITAALVVGDFKSAVSKCLAAGRIADAIVFSSCGGADLWEETRAAYFKQHRSPFVRNVLRLIVGQDLTAMVAQADLSHWKDTLAIIITYTQGANYKALMNQLGARLEASPNGLAAATLCYMCSNNVDKAVDIWTSGGGAEHGGEEASLHLHHAVEKVSVFASATQGAGQLSKTVVDIYSEYATLLASQGSLGAALSYLRAAIPNPSDEQSASLIERIFKCMPVEEQQHVGRMPPFPFRTVDVVPDANLHRQEMQRQEQLKREREEQMRREQMAKAAAAAAQGPNTMMNNNRPPIGGGPGMGPMAGGMGMGGRGPMPPGTPMLNNQHQNQNAGMPYNPNMGPGPGAPGMHPNPNANPNANLNPLLHNPYANGPGGGPGPMPVNPMANRGPAAANTQGRFLMPVPGAPVPSMPSSMAAVSPAMPTATMPAANANAHANFGGGGGGGGGAHHPGFPPAHGTAPVPGRPMPVGPAASNPNQANNQAYPGFPNANPNANQPPAATAFPTSSPNRPVMPMNPHTAGAGAFPSTPSLPVNPNMPPANSNPNLSAIAPFNHAGGAPPPRAMPPVNSPPLPNNGPNPNASVAPARFNPAPPAFSGGQPAPTGMSGMPGMPTGAPAAANANPNPAFFNPPNPAANAAAHPAVPTPSVATPPRPAAASVEKKTISTSSGDTGQDQMFIKNTLEQCVDQVNGDANLKASEKKRVSDVSKKLGELYAKFGTADDLAPGAQQELLSLCQAVANRNVSQALSHHVNLVTNYWEGNANWLPGVKSLLLLVKNR